MSTTTTSSTATSATNTTVQTNLFSSVPSAPFTTWTQSTVAPWNIELPKFQINGVDVTLEEMKLIIEAKFTPEEFELMIIALRLTAKDPEE